MTKRAPESSGVAVTVDARQVLGPLPHIWRSIGYDEINWTYTPVGKSIYARLATLGDVPYYVRNHNALTSGNGLSYPAWGSTNVYKEDRDGNPIYNWDIIDRIYDTMTGAGCLPLVELSFMPRDLSVVQQDPRQHAPTHGTYFYDLSSRYPPKDYGRWQELVYNFVSHCWQRYGVGVRDWRFELWNEPDLEEYWRGGLEGYCRLYDHSAAAVKAVDPDIKIGGPAIARHADFLDGFLAHCESGTNYVTGGRGAPLDFISCHLKGTTWPHPGTWVQPSFKRMLDNLDQYILAIKKHASLAQREVYLDECDIDVGTIMGVHDNPCLAFRNTEYFASFLCRLTKHLLDIAARDAINLAAFTSWAFYFEGKRAFEGNRVLFDIGGLEKPAFQALRLLAHLGDKRLALEAPAAGALSRPVDGIAARGSDGAVAVVVWNFDEDMRVEGATDINLVIEGLPVSQMAVRHYRVDADHSNTHSVWRALGSPDYPTPEQMAILRQHEGLEMLEPAKTVEIRDGRYEMAVHLPMHGVSLVELAP